MKLMKRQKNRFSIFNLGLAAIAFIALPLLLGAEEKTTIAVVGGTSFGYPPDFGKGLVEEEGSFTVQTKAGESPHIYRLRYQGVPFYYIRMHGNEARKEGQKEGWHFVTTWAALHQLGVTHAFGGATGGAINTGYDFDDLVIADDVILYGNQRPQNILRAAGIERKSVFANFVEPLCPDLRRLLIEEAEKSYHGRIHASGVIIQDDPGRFETPAEIRMMRALGADWVSHNVGTETIYARQLGIHFALINSVSNPAVGTRPFTFEDMQNSVQRITAGSVPIVLECIARIPNLEHTCGTECTGEPYEGIYTKPKEVE